MLARTPAAATVAEVIAATPKPRRLSVVEAASARADQRHREARAALAEAMSAPSASKSDAEIQTLSTSLAIAERTLGKAIQQVVAEREHYGRQLELSLADLRAAAAHRLVAALDDVNAELRILDDIARAVERAGGDVARRLPPAWLSETRLVASQLAGIAIPASPDAAESEAD
jgi:hypothetical protein